MVRTAIVSSLLGSLLVVSAACGSKDDKHPTGPTGPTGGPGVSAAASAADLVGFLPADSELVAGFDAGQLRQSALWKKFAPQLMEKVMGNLTKFQTACKFDPIATAQKVAIGVKMSGSPQGVVVVHGFDRTAMLACIEQLSDDKMTFKVDHDVVTMTHKATSAGAFQFVDATTMVAFIGAQASREGLEAAIKAGTPLRASPAFTDLIGAINTNDSVWALVNGNSDVFKAAPFHPKAVFGSVQATDGLALHAHLKMPSPDDATSVVTMLEQGAGQARPMVQTLDIGAKGDDVSISVAMTEAQLETLMSMAGAFN